MEKDNTETFNDFVHQCVLKLNIPRYQSPLVDSDQTEYRVGHPILRIIEQYKNDLSNIVISNQNMDRQFSFQEITKPEINQEILNLDSSKVCHELELPAKIIKAVSDIFIELIAYSFRKLRWYLNIIPSKY